jgi:hypothetical protein
MLSSPVRKIRPSSRSITGKRPSQKTKRIQAFESSLERDLICLVEYDETVETYGVQPLTIQYVDNGKGRRYTPDLLIYYKPALNKKGLLCEVKYEAELIAKREEYEPKFRAAEEYCKTSDLEFRVFTEKDIRTPFLDNIKFISRYHYGSVNDELLKLIAAKFNAKKYTPIEILNDHPEDVRQEALYTLWRLLAMRHISCDMQVKITMDTLLWKS